MSGSTTMDATIWLGEMKMSVAGFMHDCGRFENKV